MKTFLLLILGALIILPTRARDFTYEYEGTTLTYTVIDEDSKTCQTKAGVSNKLPGNMVSGEVKIPAVAKEENTEYSVISIGEFAFSGRTGLKSVTVPNSVTSIGKGSFYNCTALTSVTLPNSITAIGNEAFYNCRLKSVDLPDSLTSIESGIFYNCYTLTSVTIPGSVTSIENEAFYNCGLESVTIPNSVTSIGIQTFRNCTKLKKSAYPSGLGNPFSAGVCIEYPRENAIIDNGVIYGPDKNIIYFVPISLAGEFILPDSVTSIGENAFYMCSKLTSAGIPDSVTDIGDEAFSHCSGLTSVTIPNSVTSIGDEAFSHCSGLTSVTISDSVTSIGDKAFYYCSGLTSVDIPNSVTSIGDEVFSYCSGLTSVTISDSVTSISNGAFYMCSALISATIPNTVTSIGELAFFGCSALSSVTIPNYVISIGEKAFSGCESLSSITLPNSVTSIGNYAFYNCRDITSITIPSSVTSIGKYAFLCGIGLTEIIVEEGNKIYSSQDGVLFNFDRTSLIQYPAGKKSLEYVIPNSVTSIDDYAFYMCPTLTKIILSPEVKVIYSCAFCDCAALDTIVFGPNISVIYSYGFYNCPLSNIYFTSPTPPYLGEDPISLSYDGNRNAFFQNEEIEGKYLEYYGWQQFLNSWAGDNGKYNLMTEPTELRVEDCSPLTGRPGDTFRLSAKLYPEDVTLPYVFWRSTDPEIASVDSDGLVTIHADLSEAVPADEGDESQAACKIIAETLYYDGPVVEIPVVYSQSSGISDIADSDNSCDIDPDAPAEVFTLQGIRVSESLDKLSAGIYIVRQGNKVKKIAVR